MSIGVWGRSGKPSPGCEGRGLRWVAGQRRALRRGGVALASKTQAGNLNSVTIHISSCERTLEASCPCWGTLPGRGCRLGAAAQGRGPLPSAWGARPPSQVWPMVVISFWSWEGRSALPSTAGPQPPARRLACSAPECPAGGDKPPGMRGATGGPGLLSSALQPARQSPSFPCPCPPAASVPGLNTVLTRTSLPCSPLCFRSLLSFASGPLHTMSPSVRVGTVGFVFKGGKQCLPALPLGSSGPASREPVGQKREELPSQPTNCIGDRHVITVAGRSDNDLLCERG